MKLLFNTIIISLLVLASSAYAQRKSGVIDKVRQDDGYIIISGNRIEYREHVVITYKGSEVSTTNLDEGIRVTYTLRNDGSVESIKLIGPTSKLDEMFIH